MTTSKMKPKTWFAMILATFSWQPTADSQETASVDTFLSRAIDVLPIAGALGQFGMNSTMRLIMAAWMFESHSAALWAPQSSFDA